MIPTEPIGSLPRPIPLFEAIEQPGTTNDSGFSPFSGDPSTSRDTAFEEIRARIDGTALASASLGVL